MSPQKSWQLKIRQVSRADHSEEIVSGLVVRLGCQCFPAVFPGPPSPPLDLHVTDAGRKHIAIAWKPPEKNGGSPIIGYHVEMCPVGTEKWMRVNSRPVKDLKFKVEEGIVPDKEYVLRVRAINAVGVSEPSEISENVVAKDPDCKNSIYFIANNIFFCPVHCVLTYFPLPLAVL